MHTETIPAALLLPVSDFTQMPETRVRAPPADWHVADGTPCTIRGIPSSNRGRSLSSRRVTSAGLSSAGACPGLRLASSAVPGGHIPAGRRRR